MVPPERASYGQIEIQSQPVWQSLREGVPIGRAIRRGISDTKVMHIEND
jgi:hypothetical protein